MDITTRKGRYWAVVTAVALVAVGLVGTVQANEVPTPVLVCANEGGNITLPDKSGTCKAGEASFQLASDEAVDLVYLAIQEMRDQFEQDLQSMRDQREAVIGQAIDQMTAQIAAAKEEITAEREAAEAAMWAAIAAAAIAVADVGVGVADVEADVVELETDLDDLQLVVGEILMVVAAIDTDGDGIPDIDDACPTLFGEPSDVPEKHGCPIIE